MLAINVSGKGGGVLKEKKVEILEEKVFHSWVLGKNKQTSILNFHPTKYNPILRSNFIIFLELRNVDRRILRL